MRRAIAFSNLVLLVGALSVCTVLASVALGAEARAAAPVREIALDNGLRIFVVERATSPTFAAVYQFAVGGTTDPKGRSGIAHLLEHMMFKGTTRIGTLDASKEAVLLDRLDRAWHELHAELDRRDDPFHPADEEKIARLNSSIEALQSEHKKLIVKSEFDELITRAGGVSLNASTSPDATRYQVQLPANRLELWFRMESERLLHPVFREFYSERDVVHEERRLRTDNTASGRADEALDSLLFTAHPYGTPVVGWPRDLSRLERRDAMDYFTTYYSPSNCVMILVGDVRTAEVERLARRYFGPWKRQEIPRLSITSEPAQQGERRRVVEFDSKPDLRMAWMTVPEGHPDQYALDVLASVLGGLASSRIDQTIVQQQRIAARASAAHYTQKHAGYFLARGTLRGEHTTAELEQALEREIARIQTEGVTEREVESARTAVETARVRGLKSNLGQALSLANAFLVSGRVDYAEEYERRIDAVTAEQVKAAAVNYLKPQRKCVVEVKSVAGVRGDDASGAGVEHQRGALPEERGRRHSRGFEQTMRLIRAAKPVELRVPEIGPEVGKDVRRVELPSGITVYVKEDHSAPSIEMSFAWLGGFNSAPIEELARYELASRLLTEGGTEELSPADLDVRQDELGMDFTIWIGPTLSGASFWSLARNFDESFDVAMDMLIRPRLAEERFQILKGQYVEGMRRREEAPGRAVNVLLNHVIFGEHPRLGYVATRDEIEAVTPDAIRAAWRRYLGTDNLYIAVVGDFEASAVLERIEKELGSWRQAEVSERRFITYEPLVRPGLWLVEKQVPQPAIRLYHQIPVDRTAAIEDHAALEIMNDILGGSGFRSRLMERLRSDEGLTYGIGSTILHQGRPGEPGRIQISYQTRKDSVARSLDSTLAEFRGIIESDVSSAEVLEQIEAWSNRFIFRYTNAYSIVSRLLSNELDERPYDFDRRELEAVQRVTVPDIRRVARKYLGPERLTVAVFGSLSDSDREALAGRFDVRVLPAGEVFRGGYDAPGVPAPQ